MTKTFKISCYMVELEDIWVSFHHLKCNNCITFWVSLLPVDVDISSLTNSMAAILCLSIHCRIPVTVIEYYSVSTSQVHSYTTTAC